MNPPRSISVFVLTLTCSLFVLAGSAFADARSECPNVDAEFTGANIADVRTAVICLTNRERISRGMGALSEDSRLTAAAQAHSDDMAAKDYFAHVDKSGGEPWDRAEKAGYANGYVGENISAGHTSALPVTLAWMKSSGHCLNILKSQYVDIGIGIATDSGSEYGTYWTMVLGGNDPAAAKVTVRCPVSELTPYAAPATTTKAKITSAKRLKDGRYKVQGKITPVAKGTIVKLTIRRGNKLRKYTVKTSRLGSFVKTMRAPGGTGKVFVSAKV